MGYEYENDTKICIYVPPILLIPTTKNSPF